jgi:hypothetical protein
MRTILPRRGRRLGVLVWAIVLGAPALAQAQLFPNLPIRRERPDCANENPQYKMIRQEYWGYYPTCWRRFPAGWGCPSPDAPNWEQAKRDIPLDKLPDAEDLDDDSTPPSNGTDPAQPPAEGAPGVRPPVLPELPSDDDSPFTRPVTPPAVIPDSPPAGGPPADPPPATAQTRGRRGRSMVAGLFSSRKR